ncbi:MAG: hypothetical protein WCB04_11390, partial [Mycobacteriales bacterium]
SWHGTDRQVRGLLLAVLRAADGPVPVGELDVVWAEAGQRARALDTLVTDGLAHPLPGGSYALGGPDPRRTTSNMKQP